MCMGFGIAHDVTGNMMTNAKWQPVFANENICDFLTGRPVKVQFLKRSQRVNSQSFEHTIETFKVSIALRK